MKTYLLSALTAFGFSLLFCLVLIPILRRMKAGQNILSYVKEHKKKAGTPTMGGLAFVAAAVCACALFIEKAERNVLLTLAIGLAYMIVGLLDDFLKKRHGENLGLRAWQKFAFQTSIAILAGIYCVRTKQTFLYLPFTQIKIDLGMWALPFFALVFVASVNAVNLTDGLDGLASASAVPFFTAFGILLALQGASQGMRVICFALVGALLAYLLFNVSPASVFMGDTGSLSLGGFVACVGTLTGNALYIAVIGFVFVLSVISVLIQVIYYKVTHGKRVFLMSPIHHHFQQKGFSESKIAYAYFLVTLLLGTVCILPLL